MAAEGEVEGKERKAGLRKAMAAWRLGMDMARGTSCSQQACMEILEILEGQPVPEGMVLKLPLGPEGTVLELFLRTARS